MVRHAYGTQCQYGAQCGDESLFTKQHRYMVSARYVVNSKDCIWFDLTEVRDLVGGRLFKLLDATTCDLQVSATSALVHLCILNHAKHVLELSNV